MIIMCAQKLWRVVRRQVSRSNPVPAPCGLLGSWAATRFQEEDDDVVIAIEESTYLTVVLPLSARALCVAFREAVAAALEDLRVPALRIELELSAMEHLSFEPLRDTTLQGVLRDLEMYCGIELSYHSDLRIVQRNLNDVPHPSLPEHVPGAAVARLLGRFRPQPARPH
jgi:hypothetical protein